MIAPGNTARKAGKLSWRRGNLNDLRMRLSQKHLVDVSTNAAILSKHSVL